MAVVREQLGEPAELLERDSAAIGSARAARGAAAGRARRGGSGRRRPSRRGADRPRPQPAARLRLAVACRRPRGRGANRAPPAPVPARVRRGRVLHGRRGVHPLPRTQHAPRDRAQLPRQPGRGAGLRRVAGALAAAHGRAGRRGGRAVPLRRRAPAGAGRAAARPRARAGAAGRGHIRGGGRARRGRARSGTRSSSPGWRPRRGWTWRSRPAGSRASPW